MVKKEKDTLKNEDFHSRLRIAKIQFSRWPEDTVVLQKEFYHENNKTQEKYPGNYLTPLSLLLF